MILFANDSKVEIKDIVEYDFGKFTINECLSSLSFFFLRLAIDGVIGIIVYALIHNKYLFEGIGLAILFVLIAHFTLTLIRMISSFMRRYYFVVNVKEKNSLRNRFGKKYYIIGSSLKSDYATKFNVTSYVYKKSKNNAETRIPINESWMNNIYLNTERMKADKIIDLKSAVDKKGLSIIEEESQEEFYNRAYLKLIKNFGVCMLFIFFVYFLVCPFELKIDVIYVTAVFLLLFIVLFLYIPRPWQYKIVLPNSNTVEGMRIYYKGKKLEFENHIYKGKFAWNFYTKRDKGVFYADSHERLKSLEANRTCNYLEVYLRKRRLFFHNGGYADD